MIHNDVVWGENMNLRGKTIFILTAAGLLAFFLLNELFNYILLDNFSDLEQAYITRNVTRGIAAINNELDSLNLTVMDWAVWNDSYRFMLGINPDFEKSNLYEGVYSNLNLYSLLFIDRSGNIIAGAMCDAEGNVRYSVPASLLNHLQKSGFILSRSEEGLPTDGLLQTEEGPLLICAYPIIASSGQSSPSGTPFYGQNAGSKLNQKIPEDHFTGLNPLAPY